MRGSFHPHHSRPMRNVSFDPLSARAIQSHVLHLPIWEGGRTIPRATERAHDFLIDLDEMGILPESVRVIRGRGQKVIGVAKPHAAHIERRVTIDVPSAPSQRCKRVSTLSFVILH